MRFAICDDEITSRQVIKSYIEEYFQDNRLSLPDICEFESGEALLDDNSHFDIVFLDIEMNGISGISVGRRMSKTDKHTLFIIVTSYNDYLDEAMSFQAFRFLNKPINKPRFMRNLHDALYVSNTNNERIAVVTKKEVLTMFSSDIIMIEVCNRKVTVYTTYGSYESKEPLTYYSERLNPNIFFQPQKGFLINMGFIDSFNNDKVSLFQGRYHAYVTVRKYKELKNAYLMYLNSIT